MIIYKYIMQNLHGSRDYKKLRVFFVHLLTFLTLFQTLPLIPAESGEPISHSSHVTEGSSPDTQDASLDDELADYGLADEANDLTTKENHYITFLRNQK